MIPTTLLPAGANWCIAGGYAACPALASDTDVWVTVDDCIVAHEAVVAHWRTMFATADIDVDDAPNTGDGHQQDEYLDSRTLKVGTVRTNGRAFHVMVTYHDVAGVLGRFDISTHQVALRPDGTVVRGAGWTAPSIYPVVFMTTPRTELRMRKLCARYGHAYREGTLA